MHRETGKFQSVFKQCQCWIKFNTIWQSVPAAGAKKKQTLLHQCLIYPSEGLRRFILNRCVREVVWNKAVYD